MGRLDQPPDPGRVTGGVRSWRGELPPHGPGTPAPSTVPGVSTRVRVPAAVAVGGALAAVLLLSGCQTKSAINQEPQTGSTTAAVVNGVQDVVLTTDQKYRFKPSTITVHPGKVRITLKNIGTGAPHDWQLQGFPAAYDVPLAQAGQTRSIEFTAPAAGTYQFVCSIHIKQGQTGTLVVLSN